MHYLPGWGAARFIKHLSTLRSFNKKLQPPVAVLLAYCI